MITGTVWANDLYSRLVGIGFEGSSLQKLANTIGDGSAMAVVGVAFTTVDVGTVPGAGIGTGTGITGLSASAMSNNMYTLSVSSFGSEGSKLKDICDAIAASCVAQLALAHLASVDAPVVIGTGSVVVGSIAVTASSWSSAISTQGEANGFQGSQWPNWAQAIGGGQAQEVLADGTGSLIIAGATPGSPSPGTGGGTGTIS